MTDSDQDFPKWSWMGMIASAIGAQLCCGLPWLLVSMGVTGSFISQLEALSPFRPWFIAAAGIFFVAGWVTLVQRQRQGCPLPRR